MKTRIAADQAVGRTVEGISYLDEALFISFTDNTYLVLLADSEDETARVTDVWLNKLSTRDQFDPLHSRYREDALNAQVVTQAEYDARVAHDEKLRTVRDQADDTQQLQRLKAKYPEKFR